MPGVVQKLNRLLERDPNRFLRRGKLERLCRIRLADYLRQGDILGAGLQLVDDEEHQFLAEIEDFVVVVYKFHLEIKSRELMGNKQNGSI